METSKRKYLCIVGENPFDPGFENSELFLTLEEAEALSEIISLKQLQIVVDLSNIYNWE
jgi:hypothetical protein